MKRSTFNIAILAFIFVIVNFFAYYLGTHLGLPNLKLPNINPAQPASATMGKDYIATAAVAVIGGLILALLVFLIPDRWRRIEAEVLSLRQAQDKSLDDLRKRADERIADKLDAASRQAQGILDHVSGLADRFPWITGITEVGFAPNSNACQIVVRNAARLFASEQGMLAHDYLYSWTKDRKNEPQLEGSPSDFIEIADFARLVLCDDYLAISLIAVGYKLRIRQPALSAAYLRALSRSGFIDESIDIAETVRRVILPSWREKFSDGWFTLRRLGKPTSRKPPATADAGCALAVFFGLIGDSHEFSRALAKSEELAKTEKEKLQSILAKAEALAAMGRLPEAAEIVNQVTVDHAAKEGLTIDLIWALRRCERGEQASTIFDSASARAQSNIRADFGTELTKDESTASKRTFEPAEASTKTLRTARGKSKNGARQATTVAPTPRSVDGAKVEGRE